MAKRGQNEGSIIKLKDGTWRAYMNLGYQAGKRKRKYFRGKTRSEVQEKLTAALRNRQLGMQATNDSITVGSYLERWLNDSVKPSVRPRTFKSYSQLVILHVEPDLGRIKLAKLTPQDIQELMNRKLKQGLSPRTVQYIHAVIRRALVQARKWQLVHQNVAKLVDPPRAKRPDVVPLTPEQTRSLLKAAKGERLEALYTVAVALGLRRSEALGLRWEDIDFETETLRVRFSLQRIDGKLQLVEPKSAKSKRSIAMPNIMVRALREHRKRQLEEKLLLGPDWRETGFVFTSTIGTPIEPDNIGRWFKPLLKKAGLPDIRFHDLRHTAASLLLVQGVQPRVVMETLGHSQIGLTMNTYSHVMPILLRDAADQMDEILGG